MNKKLYRIRNKKTGEFLQLGYKSKSSWLVKPIVAIREHLNYRGGFNKEDYEYVIYELVETKTEPII